MAGVMTVISGVFPFPPLAPGSQKARNSLPWSLKQSSLRENFSGPICVMHQSPAPQKIVTTEPHRVEERWLREEETYNLG